jgi:hypothetical protein
MSHADYFKNKGVKLEYPNSVPMVAVPGRRNETIYLPAELIMGNELDPSVKEKLPVMASFRPERRREEIDSVSQFLIPGAQTTKGKSGLLPSVGINLANDRLKVAATVIPSPELLVAGVRVPAGSNFGNAIIKANFKVGPNQANALNVILVRPPRLAGAASAGKFTVVRLARVSYPAYMLLIHSVFVPLRFKYTTRFVTRRTALTVPTASERAPMLS